MTDYLDGVCMGGGVESTGLSEARERGDRRMLVSGQLVPGTKPTRTRSKKEDTEAGLLSSPAALDLLKPRLATSGTRRREGKKRRNNKTSEGKSEASSKQQKREAKDETNDGCGCLSRGKEKGCNPVWCT
jgi:hypothetical protein